MFIGKTKIILMLFISIFISSLKSHPTSGKSYTLAERTFFEKNRWYFMDEVFMKYVDKESSCFDGKPLWAALSLGAVPVLIALFKNFKERKKYWDRSKHSERLLEGLSLGGMIALLSGFIAYGLVSDAAFKKKLSKTFVWFMKNYNPDLKANISVNFKNFVPLELHDVFDAMYKEYSIQGEKYLSGRGLNPLYDLRNKIEFDVMKNKYKKPEVVTQYYPCYV